MTPPGDNVGRVEPCSPKETGSPSFHYRPDCAYLHLTIADQNARTGRRIKEHRRVLVVRPTDYSEYQRDTPIGRNGKTVIQMRKRIGTTGNRQADVPFYSWAFLRAQGRVLLTVPAYK